MNEKQATAFYYGAATFMDLDSDEVDRILSENGLTIEANTVQECLACVRANHIAAPPPLALPEQFTYLTVTEAAEQSDLTDRTIRAAIKRGDLLAGKRHGRWRIAQKTFQHWLDNPRMHKTGPKPTRSAE